MDIGIHREDDDAKFSNLVEKVLKTATVNYNSISNEKTDLRVDTMEITGIIS